MSECVARRETLGQQNRERNAPDMFKCMACPTATALHARDHFSARMLTNLLHKSRKCRDCEARCQGYTLRCDGCGMLGTNGDYTADNWSSKASERHCKQCSKKASRKRRR